jgi:hypothetical protein
MAGYVPVTLDNLSTGHESFVRWGPLIKGDAASSDVGESVVNPQKYYENNVAGRCLDVCCRPIVERLSFRALALCMVSATDSRSHSQRLCPGP